MEDLLEGWKLRQVLATAQALRPFLADEQTWYRNKEELPTRNVRVPLQSFDNLFGPSRDFWTRKARSLTTEQGYRLLLGKKGPMTKTENDRARTRKKDLGDALQRFAALDKRLPVSFGVQIDGCLTLEERDGAMKAFWDPYFVHCDSVTIVYAESVFFRGGPRNRAFIRSMDVNELDALDKLYSECALPAGWVTQNGGTQFVPAGDCAAVISLAQSFDRNGLPATIVTAPQFHRKPQPGEGIIVLGSGRTIPWLDQSMRAQAFPYQLASTGIEHLHEPGKSAHDDFTGPIVRGLVARYCCEKSGAWITLIGANHGRCSEAWVRNVSSSRNITRMFRTFRWDQADPVPPRFQITFSVRVDRGEILQTSLEEVSVDLNDCAY